MLGALVVLGFIALGVLIYGILWLTYQLVKASIVGVVLIVYFITAGVGILVLLLLDAERVPATWNQVKRNMAWWIGLAYPPNHPRAVRPGAIELQATASTHRVTRSASTIPSGNAPWSPAPGSFFCTSCGTRFSMAMNELLLANHACFCELCGQQYHGKHVAATIA